MSVYIRVKNLGVSFPILNGSNKSLRKSLLNAATGGSIAKEAGQRVEVKALDNINLDLKSGDRLGVIGHNGSGKSTLLRCLVGAYHPTSGVLETSGSIASLLDINLGVNHEATGYENIIVRGILMGMSRREIESKIDDIAAFSELGDFLHLPVRTYSSGMIMRLGFSVSTSVEADILLMDEWLSVGDSDFHQKATKRLNEMMENSSILILASHDDTLINQVCNKTMVLNHGKQQ